MSKDSIIQYSILDTNALIYLFIPQNISVSYKNYEINYDTELNGRKRDKLLNLQDFFKENKNDHKFAITPTIMEEFKGKDTEILYEELERRDIVGKFANTIVKKRGEELSNDLDLLDIKASEKILGKIEDDYKKFGKSLSMDEWKSLSNGKDPIPEDNDLHIITEAVQAALGQNEVTFLSDDKHFTLPTYRKFLKEDYQIEILPLDNL